MKIFSDYQKKILQVISDSSENNYILEVFDVDEVKTTYTLTNGEDDFEVIRSSTMKKIKSFDFILSRILPSSDRIVRTKHYIHSRDKYYVWKSCL